MLRTPAPLIGGLERTTNLLVMEHEAAVFEAFFVEPQKARLRKLSEDPGSRPKLRSYLAHPKGLDPVTTTRIARGNQSHAQILELLRSEGAPEMAHLISEHSEWDEMNVPLDAALALVVGMGFGTIVSCIPGRLAYYEAEDRNARFLLKKRAPDSLVAPILRQVKT